MNPISRALTEVRFQIPEYLLQAAFSVRTQHMRASPDTLSENILATVVRPRVLLDCNIVGGTEVLIRLDGYLIGRPDDFTAVYRIPKNATQGRSILSVSQIAFNDPTGMAYYGLATGCQSTQMMATAGALLDSAGTIPVTSSASVQLVGENVVSVRDTTILPANAYLRCLLASDEDMSHLQLRSTRNLSKLIVLAVKSYIYKRLVIDVDVAELLGGQQLGRFREVLDGYADSEELYQTEIREVMTKVLYMNDQTRYTRMLRTIIGGRR